MNEEATASFVSNRLNLHQMSRFLNIVDIARQAYRSRFRNFPASFLLVTRKMTTSVPQIL